MKILGFELAIKKAPRPVPAELSTLTAQVEHLEARLAELEAFAKEKGTRLETIYRKVYRDEEKLRGDGEGVVTHPVAQMAMPRPGDSFRL